MKNTKGQFFIIFAVLFGFLLLGVTTFYNYVQKPDFNSQRFYQACDNYDYEIQRISEMYSKGDLSVSEFDAIENFTQTFVEYQRSKNNNISLWAIYSLDNSEQYIDDDFFTQNEDLDKTDEISLNNHDFYYIIQLKKGEEVFNCEKK